MSTIHSRSKMSQTLGIAYYLSATSALVVLGAIIFVILFVTQNAANSILGFFGYRVAVKTVEGQTIYLLTYKSAVE